MESRHVVLTDEGRAFSPIWSNALQPTILFGVRDGEQWKRHGRRPMVPAQYHTGRGLPYFAAHRASPR
jgi:hypothetical protein